MNAIAYIVVDDPSLIRQFEQSALSLRRHGWTGPIIVITNIVEGWPDGVEYTQLIVANAAPMYGEKMRICRRLAYLYDAVFYLDTDTVAIADVTPVFDLPGDLLFRRSIDQTLAAKLGRFRVKDMTCKAAHHPEELEATAAEVPGDFPFFHAGTFLYRRNAAVEAFFAAWELEMLRWGLDGNDEWALVRAAHATNTRPGDLPWAYNAWPKHRRSAVEAKAAGDVVLHFYGPTVKPLLFSFVA